MRIDLNEDGTLKAIVLSKRNLLALLEKLEWDSARTIICNDKGMEIPIKAEPDVIHYFGRAIPPGIMKNKDGNIY
jgi:hypothetical protein